MTLSDTSRRGRTLFPATVKGLLIMALGALVTATAHGDIPASERQVLLDLYNSTDGPNWVDNSGWGGAPGTECDWYGITCMGADENVLYIDLSWNGLSGTLPPLTDLSELDSFDIGASLVEGPIPDLPSDILEFRAGQTSLSGSIPDFQSLPELDTFIVTHAQLTGTIPELSGTSLQILNVQRNQLEGEIPSLSGMTSLASFSVDHNQLEGQIPDLTGLTSLTSFFISSNDLSGEIPDLSSLTTLEFFGASDNQLTGSIPELTNLSSLQLFIVENNLLSGTIPSLSGLTSLSTFDVSSNQLSGELPNLGDAAALYAFDAEENQLTGEIPALEGLNQLNNILLAGNSLSGPVPDPADTNLEPGGSSLCGNYLVSSGDSEMDEAWETATGGDWIACQTPLVVPVNNTWSLVLLMLLTIMLGAPFASTSRRS